MPYSKQGSNLPRRRHTQQMLLAKDVTVLCPQQNLCIVVILEFITSFSLLAEKNLQFFLIDSVQTSPTKCKLLEEMV